jgi:low affinity Fe/Cu permease
METQKQKEQKASGNFLATVSDVFRVFARKSSVILGSAWTFAAAILIIITWGLTGPKFHYSDTWQLIINTGTTIVTFLMVFLIQNTQNRDAKSVHLKLDEVIRVLKGAPLYQEAIWDTIEKFEATGSPVITDGEQRKYHNFGTYCVEGLANIAPDGFQLPFVSHVRRWPRLVSGPFRYKRYADSFLDFAKRHARVPVKQAVISPSALSLMYPADGNNGYPREQFIDDLLAEHEKEVRSCLQKGAHNVQIDFTEGRLAIKKNTSAAWDR